MTRARGRLRLGAEGGMTMIEVLIGDAGPYPWERDTETLLGNAA